MQRQYIIVAALLGFLGVGLGAFGAHGLASILQANGREATFETATHYHLIHALALLVVALLSERYPERWLRWAGVAFIIGVVLFSGSLYVLAIFNLGFMGAIAPLGGVAMLVGWSCLGVAAWQREA